MAVRPQPRLRAGANDLGTPPRHRDNTLQVNHICGACSESRREVERALIESVGPRREPALHVHGETLVKNHCRIARANLHFALRP